MEQGDQAQLDCYKKPMSVIIAQRSITILCTLSVDKENDGESFRFKYTLLKSICPVLIQWKNGIVDKIKPKATKINIFILALLRRNQSYTSGSGQFKHIQKQL